MSQGLPNRRRCPQCHRVSPTDGGAPNVTGSPQPTAVPLMSQGLPNRRRCPYCHRVSPTDGTLIRTLKIWIGPLLAAKSGPGVHFLPGPLLACQLPKILKIFTRNTESTVDGSIWQEVVTWIRHLIV